MSVDTRKFDWAPGDIVIDSTRGATAAAFGKPNQPRDYHGRWGQGGSKGSDGDSGGDTHPLHADDPGTVKDHLNEDLNDGFSVNGVTLDGNGGGTAQIVRDGQTDVGTVTWSGDSGKLEYGGGPLPRDDFPQYKGMLNTVKSKFADANVTVQDQQRDGTYWAFADDLPKAKTPLNPKNPFSTDAETLANHSSIEKKYLKEIDDYTGDPGYSMNAVLRADKSSMHYPTDSAQLKSTKASIDKLHKMFKETPPLKKSISVFRGVEGADRVFGKKKLQPGTVITDKAFMSTTAHEDYAWQYATEATHSTKTAEQAGTMMTIDVPKGMKAMTLTKESGAYDEPSSEIVLPAGTSLKIVSDTKPRGKMRVIHATVVKGSKPAR